MASQVDFKGKKVVVTGAASGMALACVKLLSELDAEIYGLDLKEVPVPIKKYIPINLGSKEAIDKAIAEIPDGIDAVFHVAGIAGTIYGGRSFSPLDVATINFIGARYFIESIAPKCKENSAIVAVSSIAGCAWRTHIDLYRDFVTNIKDWKAAQDFVNAHTDDPQFLGGPATMNKPYVFSKECLCIYVATSSWDFAEKKIRINTISPGATKTPMHDDFNELVGKKRGSLMPVTPIGVEAEPEQIASAMIAINSDLCSYVSGQDLAVDYGMGVRMTTAVKK